MRQGILKGITVVLALTISFSLAGCSSVNITINSGNEKGGQESEKPVSETMVGMPDPWREITEDEALQYPRMFVVPEGASNTVWRVLDSAADAKEGKAPLVELDFDIKDEYGSQSFTARYQYGAGEDNDISGMYYDWTVTDEGKLSNWGMGNMDAKFKRYVSDDEMADLCTWYDIEIGISYCVCTVAPDLDGFDIQGIVEAMYPGDQIYGDMSGEKEKLDIKDLENCDTFTQIVDRLGPGHAYANVKLGSTDVLLVASGAFDDTDGHYNCIDADIFCYIDGKPKYIGNAASNSTAYPIAVKNGFLYVGGHHFIAKYTVTDNELVIAEVADELFDENGNATYYYSSDNGEDNSNISQDEAEAIFDRLNEEMSEADIVDFDVIR